MRTDEVKHPERGRWGKPLAGVRVLAAEQMQALPYATQLLAHLGADVVKVEPPGRGESGRGARPTLEDHDGRTVGATYLRNNLGKRSLTLDLKQPEGRDLFERLVPRFDVIASNFKAGAMERLGLGYERIAALHPGAIYVSLSGFGELVESPYASWPAYAPNVEAMAGIYEPNRKEGEPPPVVVAGALGDNASALFTVIGILAALRHREQTGEGQQVDVAMYDATLAMADMVPQLWSMGAPKEWAAAGSTAIVSAFRARDGYFVVSIFREHHFERFCALIGHPGWPGDERFATREDWARQIEPLIRPAVETWARDKTRLEACHALSAIGVAAGPSQVAEDIRADPHVAARNMLVEVPRSDAPDPMLVVGNPVKLSHMTDGPISRYPGLGEHTEHVLGEELALSGDELMALRTRGVI